MFCTIGKGTCRPLRHDELLPTWPRFSPDGEKLAYLTQVGSTQLTVVSAKDGHTLTSWDACYQCEPVWSSATTVWALEISAGHRVWFERDAMTGKKTGNRFEAPSEGAGADASQCWPKTPPSDAPFAQPAHAEIEQSSLILGLR